MLVTTKEMLEKARKSNYAVPAINTQGGNYDIIRACCLAAEEMQSPIILAHYVSTGAYAGHDWFYEVGKWMANKVNVPVAIHLDHGDSTAICKECLDIGFTSIMYDGSLLSVEENAKNTNEVIEMSHKKGVPVEAEIGELLRLDDIKKGIQSTNTVKVEDVKRFLELCHPDSLAIGIGNAHGYYTDTPNIRLEILEEVCKFTDIPLVLHGCTGMSHDIIKKSLNMGISKINFGTQIRFQYMEHLAKALEEEKNGRSFIAMKNASDWLKEDVKKIIELSNSQGQA
ncbi:MAG: class II fructose-bisphosphate aldolase [Clostridia bacterium]